MDKFKKSIIQFYTEYILDLKRVHFLTFFVALVDFWWAFIFILPINTYATSKSFSIISSLISEELLAVFVFALGFGLLFFISKKHVINLRFMVILNELFWFFISFSFAFSNPLSTGTGIYFLISFVCGVIYLRLRETRT